jgi:transcription initiation factor TFIIB
MNEFSSQKTHKNTIYQRVHKRSNGVYRTLQIKHTLYLQQLANHAMVWYITPDQILIQDKEEKMVKEEDNDSNRQSPSYAFSTDTKLQTVENKNNIISSNDIQTLLCSICKRSDKIITDPESGEVICSSCGVVILDRIEDISRPDRHVGIGGGGAGGIGGEGRQTDNTRARTGAPTSLARHDMGLATIIGKDDRDASGHKIDTSIHSTMQRLRTWDSRIQSNAPSNRNLRLAFELLDKLKDKLGLSDAIIEKTAYMYRKAQERKFSRGKSIPAAVSAATYIACREMGISTTLKDIAGASNLKRKNIARTYRQLMLELDYKVPNTDPIKCIAKVANKANLSEKTKRQALNIMKKVTENEISAGKDPMGIAATVLYISCIKTGENRSQKDISNAAGVTDATLRNRFKDLKTDLLI